MGEWIPPDWRRSSKNGFRHRDPDWRLSEERWYTPEPHGLDHFPLTYYQKRRAWLKDLDKDLLIIR